MRERITRKMLERRVACLAKMTGVKFAISTHKPDQTRWIDIYTGEERTTASGHTYLSYDRQIVFGIGYRQAYERLEYFMDGYDYGKGTRTL